MLVFGGCKTHFHIQEGAEGQQCSGALCPCLQTVMGTGSSQPGSADGNLNSQQYCSTGQNYILMTDLLHKQGKGVVTCFSEILSTWRSSYVFIHGKLLSKVE